MDKEISKEPEKIGLGGFTQNVLSVLTDTDEQEKVLKTVASGRKNGQIGSALAAKSVLTAGGIDVDKYEKEMKDKLKGVIPIKTAGATIDELEKLATKKKSEFQKLKDNKVELTSEERKEVIDRKAVWHGDSPNLAVWKSIDPKTDEVTFVTHTHRAYNTAPTLKGACGKFHDFIKSTASEGSNKMEKTAREIIDELEKLAESPVEDFNPQEKDKKKSFMPNNLSGKEMAVIGGVGLGNAAYDTAKMGLIEAKLAPWGLSKLNNPGPKLKDMMDQFPKQSEKVIGGLNKVNNAAKNPKARAALYGANAAYALGEGVVMGGGLVAAKRLRDKSKAKKAEKSASETIDELEKLAAKEDDQFLGKEEAAYGATAGAAILAKKQSDRGNLTGRETLYHGTDKKNVESILREGVKSSKANEPDSFTRRILGHIKGAHLDDLTYFGRNKSISEGVNTSRAVADGGEAFSSQTVLKAKVPSWKMVEVDNPELLGGKDEADFIKKFREAQKNNPVAGLYQDSALKQLYSGLGRKNTAVFQGDVGPEFIKGSKKYKGAGIKEIGEFAKANPKRFAKGSGAVALTAGLGTYALKQTSDRMKKEKTASEVIDELEKDYNPL